MCAETKTEKKAPVKQVTKNAGCDYDKSFVAFSSGWRNGDRGALTDSGQRMSGCMSVWWRGGRWGGDRGILFVPRNRTWYKKGSHSSTLVSFFQGQRKHLAALRLYLKHTRTQTHRNNPPHIHTSHCRQSEGNLLRFLPLSLPV